MRNVGHIASYVSEIATRKTGKKSNAGRLIIASHLSPNYSINLEKSGECGIKMEGIGFTVLWNLYLEL